MPNIIVRPWRPDDASALHAAARASLTELAAWLPWAHAGYALADSQAWIAHAERAWAAGSEFPMGVFDAISGEVLGGTGINQINRAHRIGNLGYWVASAHAGRGVARTAAREAIALGFGRLGLQRLEIIALPTNIASVRVAEALGAHRETVARNRIHFQGRAHDAVVFSLIPEDVAPTAG